MFNARKLCTAAVLALCALLPLTAAAQAQSDLLKNKRVLLLTSNPEFTTSNGKPNYKIHATHPRYAFKKAAEALGINNGGSFEAELGVLTGSLSNALKDKIHDADIVVLVVDGKDAVNDYSVFDSLMKVRDTQNAPPKKDRTFILFAGNSEGGGIHPAPSNFAKTIKDVTGWEDTKLAHIPGSSYVSIPFKGSNALASIFGNINGNGELHGNTYGAMQCVPKNNVLYGVGDKRCVRSRFDNDVDAYVVHSNSNCTDKMEDLVEYPRISPDANGGTPPAKLSDTEADRRSKLAKDINKEWKKGAIDPLHPDSASSLIVPQWQSNGGNGACIIFTIDESIFDRQGKPEPPTGSAADPDFPQPYSTNPDTFTHSVFDHWTQLVPMAKALLTAAVDKRACLQDKPAEDVFAPAYNGAKENELAIVAGGSVSGDYSDNRNKETVNSGVLTVDSQGNKTCTEGSPCRSLPNAGKCCTLDDLDKSCPTNFMYCSADNVGTSEALNKDVCCSADKIAQNSAGNLCCDADNPQPTGDPGSQICCKAGQENKGGVCVTPPTPICAEGQPISSPCRCISPMVDDGSGNCITPVCTEGQPISSPCRCISPMVDDGNGNCVTPVCTEGQPISSPCRCISPMVDDGSGNCITPTPPPPICQAGDNASGCTCQSPMVVDPDDGLCKQPVCQEGQETTACAVCEQPMEVQNGVCISSTPICKPPTGCSGPSAPTTGWPALLGLSALLPLLAARRRRK